MRRKIYNKLLTWKKNHKGDTAILIEGARRIGKSYIVEEFARNEYASTGTIAETRKKVCSICIAERSPHA